MASSRGVGEGRSCIMQRTRVPAFLQARFSHSCEARAKPKLHTHTGNNSYSAGPLLLERHMLTHEGGQNPNYRYLSHLQQR